VPPEKIQVVDPRACAKRDAYANRLYELRQRRGVTLSEAQELINNCNLLGAVMVKLGEADALVGGVGKHFPDSIRPALQVIKPRAGLHRLAGLYVLVTRRGNLYFLADCIVNIEPTAEDLAEIALCAAQTARRFNVTPRVARLSFSNFGSTAHPLCDKVRRAVQFVPQADPALMIDGEMMADTAVVPGIIEETYSFWNLRGGANVLSGSHFREHLLQTTRETRRCRNPRPNPHGYVETGSTRQPKPPGGTHESRLVYCK
jgi:malate dehydrogenase (oxaloacetate-decarboxylating)(NADP+)